VQTRLTLHGIISVLVVPIILENQFWGFTSYEDCVNERVFTKDEEAIIQSGTLLLANAMARYIMTNNLIVAREEALSSTRAKSAFLATMSHEIRTPLNAIIGLTEIQMQNQLPVDTGMDLEQIHNSGSTLLAIINAMLDISKIEAGSFELIPLEYDVPSLVNDTVQLNIVHIGSKPITFKTYIDSTIPNKLFGDELRIKQIMNNLLSNAFKYTKSGRVEFTLKCEKLAPVVPLDTREQINLFIEVSDSGIGIKEEDIDKIFSEYSQLDTRANRKIEGTGLGLSIAKKLVEMMGGTIGVKSEYGKGSIFTVRILQDVSEKTPIGEKTARSLEKLRFNTDKKDKIKNLVRSDLSYARVLVVDDVQTNLDVARGLMLPYKLTIDCVLSGRDAIDRVQKEDVHYNAIFMDHMMPEMDGVEATQIIRKINTDYAKTVPIIALTANAISGNEKKFLSSGFNAFISKPIDIMRLNTILNQYVRDKTQEKKVE
jgi:signal transduction histidine kinase/CheY-like chemotaxis protein